MGHEKMSGKMMRWETIRKKGRKAFVYKAAIAFAVLTAILKNAVKYSSGRELDLWYTFTDPLVFLLPGYFFGVSLWKNLEKYFTARCSHQGNGRDE